MKKKIFHINQFLNCIIFLLLLTVQFTFSQRYVSSKKKIEGYFLSSKTYKNQDNIDLALGAIEKALETAKKTEDPKSITDCYHEFSLLYYKLDKINESITYWDRAQVLLNDSQYPYGNAVHSYISALYFVKQEKYDEANSELINAEQITGAGNLANHILLVKANIALELQKYEEAFRNFNLLIINNDPYEKEYIATMAYLGLVKLKVKTSEAQNSITYAIAGLKLAKKNNFIAEIIELNKFLADTYENIENFEVSLVYNKNLLAIKDSIYSKSKIKSKAKTADEIHLQNLSKLISTQEKTIKKLEESDSRNQIITVLTSAFLTIISLLAISLYRNNHIKLKTNDLLQTKNYELQASRDAALKAMQTKTNFLSTVSHELRTPLYAVTGLTHLLLEENPSESQIEHLKALKFSGDYLLSFINDILQLNKIDAEKLTPVNSVFSLKKVLTEVVSSLQQSAKENQTKIVLEYDEKIPTNLISDSMKLSQILINLVGNGIKFTKKGQVTLITRLLEKFEDKVTIYFEVKDNGIGIEKEQATNIFESFEQGSIQINREYGGTGLGLAIVKSLLGLFNSKIELKSELGKGSAFSFEIEMIYKSPLIENAGFEIFDQYYNFKGLHLLIVEDNKINQVITKKMLEKKEMTCDIASNGTDAVEMVSQIKYDAVLMDIQMPGISGEEATILIRKFNTHTPIIALTAISMDDSLEIFYAAGCNDVVTKPFRPEVFYQKIGQNIFHPKKTTTT